MKIFSFYFQIATMTTAGRDLGNLQEKKITIDFLKIDKGTSNENFLITFSFAASNKA